MLFKIIRLSNNDLSRGIVAVLDAISVTEVNAKTLDLLIKVRDLGLATPAMFAACHICYDSSRLQSAASIFQMAMPKASRVRIRIFRGSTHIETMYHLNSFGIGQDAFPLDDHRDMDLEKLEILLQARIADESRLVHFSSKVPTDLDVITRQVVSILC